ncbi:plant UBX domain-containing protein 7-like [Argentina anserina]|uniref:plant UBX domain-containing protein 7-like n=1 Tax=Argentina anserina TaxID=57926 RepID=UPI00217644FD|nr:plant UBX domain-containing protein 7-like [Potentilla anserina]
MFPATIHANNIWAHNNVSEIISAYLIVWHEYFDTPEGYKVSTKYFLDSRTIMLVIDPMTGEAMCSWNGMVHPNDFLEDLEPYMKTSPKNNCVPKEEKNLLQHASMENMKLETSRGITSKEDLAPFQDAIPWFSSEFIEADVSAAFMESVKLKTSGPGSSKAKLD